MLGIEKIYSTNFHKARNLRTSPQALLEVRRLEVSFLVKHVRVIVHLQAQPRPLEVALERLKAIRERRLDRSPPVQELWVTNLHIDGLEPAEAVRRHTARDLELEP